ncbi:MAG TPA: HDOD domain-containing protein, partial [Rhodocyclaceae bacterium]|nr:HDOD domain-containing protein [Rhodocyclaceae bacterium]
IIHRDLKPSNILVDSEGRARVMDFGVAVRQGGEAQTQTGLSGTLIYLAPEYIDGGQITEKCDIYAAGLVMVEMLTGKPPFSGESTTAIINKILTQPIVIPDDVVVDQKLRSIVMTACARDPAMRAESAAFLKVQLAEYLGGATSPAAIAEVGEVRRTDTLEFLMRRMRHKSDFPALSDSVAAINKLTRSDRESINQLSNIILRDYGLTNKILRLVNSVIYRPAGGGGISTVSRAVIVLGFDALRNIAITVLLFDHMQNKASAREIKEAFLRANLAGMLARDAGKMFMPREIEEAYICALFHSLGQILSLYYFPEESAEIRKLIYQKGMSAELASDQILGLSFSELGIGIAEHWGFPKPIMHSLHLLPEGVIKRPASQEDGLKVLANFSNEICELIASTSKEKRRDAINSARQRFTPAIAFSDAQLQGILEKAFNETRELANILHVNLVQSPFAKQVRSWLGKPSEDEPVVDDSFQRTLLDDASPVEVEKPGIVNAVGVPDTAQSVMTLGIQDISNSLVDDFQLNDILRITLETMYRAMGFERVLLCLKDPKSGYMVGRFGFGADTSQLAKKFRFPLSDTPNVFQLAIAKGLDIIITDVSDPKIVDKIPLWFRQIVFSQTFVLLPLMIKGNPVALIYCDRLKAGSIVIPEKELSLLKTLRNQAVLAIKQSI